MAELDLNRYHFKRTVMGITILGTWFIDHDRNRPCLVLIREGEELTTMAPAVVAMDEAYTFDIPWRWEDYRENFDYRGHPQRAWALVRLIATQLRLNEHDAKTLSRIGDLIKDHLGDLISIPPYVAPDNRRLLGEAVLTNRSTGHTREIEIKDV